MRFILTFLFLVVSVNPDNLVEKEKELLESFQGNLTLYMAPEAMTNNTVFIFVDLYQILDVNEKEGLVSLKLWVFYYYHLEHIRWDPAEYAGRNTFVLPKGTFWAPDIS